LRMTSDSIGVSHGRGRTDGRPFVGDLISPGPDLNVEGGALRSHGE
jgi:hypothetical protein